MLYSSIFSRKSVRKYDAEPLTDSALSDVGDFLARVEPLTDGGAVTFRLLSSGEVSTGLGFKAPHYMLACADDLVFSLENAGYILQHLSLYMTESGIGSCFTGMAKPHKSITGELAAPPAILLAFGKPAVPMRRSDTSEFKRRKLDDILEGPYFSELVEPVRFAPSAVNSQPWFFVDNNGALDVYRRRPGGLTASVLDRANRIDMGIALCHLTLSAERLGKKIRIEPGCGGTQRKALIPVARVTFL